MMARSVGGARMGRGAIGVALTGVGVLVARALAPTLHARLMAACERMFERTPDTFPPKRMLGGIEEIRANSARTLALLEAREQARETEPPRVGSSAEQRPVQVDRREERELAAVGASAPRPDAY